MGMRFNVMPVIISNRLFARKYFCVGLKIAVVLLMALVMIGCRDRKNLHHESTSVNDTDTAVTVDSATMDIVLNSMDTANTVSVSNIMIDVKHSTVTDSRDGRVYKTVRIAHNRSEWMAENLNVKTVDSWCHGNDSTNCDIYGRLYTWDMAVSACTGLGNRWRLPTDDDWDALVDAVGGNSKAGTVLKSTTGWPMSTMADIPIGTNNIGFAALPGGFRSNLNHFVDIGGNGAWWSATEHDDGYVFARFISSDYEYVSSINDGDDFGSKGSGFSVRCIRDDVHQFGD